ncbi:MAG: hypothetical protein EPN91_02420 [Salinibacterium sp.]|nr:MAG: hypothetical protein EPN91_02420 [Salinibacterium sp.]
MNEPLHFLTKTVENTVSEILSGPTLTDLESVEAEFQRMDALARPVANQIAAFALQAPENKFIVIGMVEALREACQRRQAIAIARCREVSKQNDDWVAEFTARRLAAVPISNTPA